MNFVLFFFLANYIVPWQLSISHFIIISNVPQTIPYRTISPERTPETEDDDVRPLIIREHNNNKIDVHV